MYHFVHKDSAIDLGRHLPAAVSELFYAEHSVIVSIEPICQKEKQALKIGLRKALTNIILLVENFHFLKQVASDTRNKSPNSTKLHHIQCGEANGARYFSICVEHSVDLLVSDLWPSFVWIHGLLRQALPPSALCSRRQFSSIEMQHRGMRGRPDAVV